MESGAEKRARESENFPFFRQTRERKNFKSPFDLEWLNPNPFYCGLKGMRRVSLCHHFIRGTHFPLFISVLLTHLPRDRLENNPINTVKTLIAAIQKQSDQLLIAFLEPQTVNTKPIRIWKMGAH
jgi:hypothetical protein